MRKLRCLLIKLAAITIDKYSIIFNKQISLGAQILHLSKYLMYPFHQEYMKPNFNFKKFV